MKKRVLLVLLLILALILCGCDKRAQTPGDIIPMLREELQLEENDGTVISCIGVYTADPTTSAWVLENSLLWFSFDHDNYTYYRAVGCQQTSNGKFIVRKIYEPMTYTEDIVHVVWGGNDVYCVNDPNCRTIYSQFSSGDISMTEISLGDHPCVYVYGGAGSLDFLDEHGKSVRDGRPILPSENDAVKPPVEGPEPQVSGNPAILSFLDTLNAVLAENGHPITLAMADPTATTHKGDLKVLYTGDGDDLYSKYLMISFDQGEGTLGGTAGDSLYIRTKEDPSQEAKDAARIMFQTAIPIYDNMLNEKYAQAFVEFSPEPNGGNMTYNRYGAAASVVVDKNTQGIYTHIEHNVRDFVISRNDCKEEVGSYIQFRITRDEPAWNKATMQPVALDTIVKCLEQYGEVRGLDDRQQASAYGDEFIDAVLFNEEIGSIGMFIVYRKADEGVCYIETSRGTSRSEQYPQWYEQVCTALWTACGTEFSQEEIQLIAQTAASASTPERTFLSESTAMKVKCLATSLLTQTFMAIGNEPLSEEELAEVNTWFAWDGGPEGYPAGNSFLTCIYTQPGEMNLFEIFGGQGGTDNQNGQISDAERNALAKVQEHYSSGYEVQKFKRSSMDKLLKQYTGCKLKDSQWSDMDTFFVYLDNYDAYYTVYGGTNKSSYTMVEGWKNLDGTLSLVYKNDRTVYETGYEYCIVTLKPAESGSGFHGYWFVSNLPYIG